MTIANANYTNRYEGNGVATSFAYTFRILNETDISVIYTDSVGNETVLTIDTHYTVSGVGSATGSVTYPASGSPLAAGSFITISRKAKSTQSLDLVNQGPWNPANIEDALDQATCDMNALQEALSRTLKFTPGSGVTAANLRDFAPNAYLITDADGNVTTDTTGPTSGALNPTITSFANAQHDHTDAANGGAAVGTRLTAVEDGLSVAEADIVSHGTRLDTAETTITSHGGRLDTAEADIITAQGDIEALQIAQGGGIIGYATQAELYADLAHDAGTVGYVNDDPTPANNGNYLKVGASGAGSWAQSSYDRVATLENKDLGVFGLIVTSTVPPTFDFDARTLTFTANSVLSFKDRRYILTPGAVDLGVEVAGEMRFLFYNKTLNTFTSYSTAQIDGGALSDSDILIAAYCISAATMNMPGAVIAATSGGPPNTTFYNLIVSDNAYPDFDFVAKTITFYPNTNIVINKTRTTITPTGPADTLVLDISALTPSAQYGLFYNKTTKVFSTYTTAQINSGSATDPDILVATFNINKNLVFMAGGHRINGNLYGVAASAASRWQGKKANFIGDSITWGYNPADGTQLDSPFPSLVATTLGLTTARNYGISGSTLASPLDDSRNPMCVRYSAMDNDADLVFILGGTNDWAQNIPIGTIADATVYTFFGGLNILLNGLLTKYPTQTIVICTPMHRSDEDADLASYAVAVRQAAEKYGIACLDLYATSGFYPVNAANYAAVCPDGRHPNAAGHIKLGHRVSGFLITV